MGKAKGKTAGPPKSKHRGIIHLFMTTSPKLEGFTTHGVTGSMLKCRGVTGKEGT